MIFDLHNDLPTSGLTVAETVATAQNVTDTVIYAFWTTQLKSPEKFISDGIIRLRPYESLFAIEDLHFVTKRTIGDICKLPLMYCSLTHNEDNVLAGGAFGQGRLTDAGKYVISKLNGNKIALDVSHLNRKSFFDAIDISEYVIASHSGLDSVHEHLRNLTCEQVRLILERKGIIGLTAVKDFIGGNTVYDYINSIDRFVQKFGTDGACIGTDFYGTQPLEGLESYNDFAFISYELAKRGYTDTDIGNIFYENANKYFKNRRNYFNETRYL